jgi:hypothetical protein
LFCSSFAFFLMAELQHEGDKGSGKGKGAGKGEGKGEGKDDKAKQEQQETLPHDYELSSTHHNWAQFIRSRAGAPAEPSFAEFQQWILRRDRLASRVT